MKLFLLFGAAGALGMAPVVALSASASQSVASAYASASLSGIGRVVRADQLGSGDSAVFLYKVLYGQPQKEVALCTGKELRVGSPVLFVLGAKRSNRACPADAHYVPAEDSASFLMSGIDDAYSRRTYFRAQYPQDRKLGCAMETITVTVTSQSRGNADLEFGPFDSGGTYFSMEDLQRCVRMQTEKRGSQ